MSEINKKILLLLSAGIAFGFCYTPQRKWRLMKGIAKEWRKIEREELHQKINFLYRSKIIERKRNADGSFTFILTKKGKLKAVTYHFQEMKIEEKAWDGKWRLVVFDVPEKLKTGRDALRKKIKELGFYELQKSVFVFPYKCEDEIDFIVEYFGLREYVRFGVLESIDNDEHLKEFFSLV